MNVTPEVLAELRRLHAEFAKADDQLALATLDANERRIRQEASNEAERWLAGMWIGHGPSVLDELEAIRTERDRLELLLSATREAQMRECRNFPPCEDGCGCMRAAIGDTA